MKYVGLDGGVYVTGARRDTTRKLVRHPGRVGRPVGVPGRQGAPLPASPGREVRADQLHRGGLAAADHPGVGNVVVRGIAARGDGEGEVDGRAEVLVLGQGVGRAGCERHDRTGIVKGIS